MRITRFQDGQMIDEYDDDQPDPTPSVTEFLASLPAQQGVAILELAKNHVESAGTFWDLLVSWRTVLGVPDGAPVADPVYQFAEVITGAALTAALPLENG